MSIASYSDLLVSLHRLMYGDDVSASQTPVATLQAVINLGERRIYREIRTRYNEKAWTGTVSGNLYALPSDFIAPSVVHFGKKPLKPVSEEALIEHLDGSPSGDARYFCQAGANLRFSPAVADGTTLQGRYFYAWPDLTSANLASNTLFAAADDLFLYAALSKSAPYFGQDARIPLWESEYTRIRDELNTLHERAAYSAGRIKRRPAASVMR